jgi:hypothetical protein
VGDGRAEREVQGSRVEHRQEFGSPSRRTRSALEHRDEGLAPVERVVLGGQDAICSAIIRSPKPAAMKETVSLEARASVAKPSVSIEEPLSTNACPNGTLPTPHKIKPNPQSPTTSHKTNRKSITAGSVAARNRSRAS